MVLKFSLRSTWKCTFSISLLVFNLACVTAFNSDLWCTENATESLQDLFQVDFYCYIRLTPVLIWTGIASSLSNKVHVWMTWKILKTHKSMKLLTCWEVTNKIEVLLTVMSHVWYMPLGYIGTCFHPIWYWHQSSVNAVIWRIHLNQSPTIHTPNRKVSHVVMQSCFPTMMRAKEE